MLGDQYSDGDGIPQDYAAAAKWYRLAAEQGNAEAQNKLGVCYAWGRGVPRDTAEGVKVDAVGSGTGVSARSGPIRFDVRGWLIPTKGLRGGGEVVSLGGGTGACGCSRKTVVDVLLRQWRAKDFAKAMKWARVAADQGLGFGSYHLGLMYHTGGQGQSQDLAQAVKWYRLAAEQGERLANYKLGVMYRDGQFVPQDYTKAVKGFRMAVEWGIAEAERDLGAMYENGHGVPQDDSEAVTWYRQAAHNGTRKLSSTLAECMPTVHGYHRIWLKHTHGSLSLRMVATQML